MVYTPPPQTLPSALWVLLVLLDHSASPAFWAQSSPISFPIVASSSSSTTQFSPSISVVVTAISILASGSSFLPLRQRKLPRAMTMADTVTSQPASKKTCMYWWVVSRRRPGGEDEHISVSTWSQQAGVTKRTRHVGKYREDNGSLEDICVHRYGIKMVASVRELVAGTPGRQRDP